MNNKPKNPNNSDLSGFEEIIDLLENGSKKLEKDKKSNQANPFDLFNFLEKEKNRLEKIDVLFRGKVPNLENNPLPRKLCQIQEERLEISKSELARRLADTTSPLYKNLNDIFDKAFS